MGQEFGNDMEARDPASSSFFLTTVMYVLVVDVVLYGCILPIVGTYIAGGLANSMGWSPNAELLSTVILTFMIIYGAFYYIGESTYWKHLFSFENCYNRLLQLRDATNAASIFILIVSIHTTVEAMVGNDKGMKDSYMSEGAGYVFFKKLCDFLSIDQSILYHIGLQPPNEDSEKFENGAAYILFWAMLTASVAKLIYFNTLFTYLRAMEIFMSMKPSFYEEDDDGSLYNMSKTSFAVQEELPSKRESEFVDYNY